MTLANLLQMAWNFEISWLPNPDPWTNDIAGVSVILTTLPELLNLVIFIEFSLFILFIYIEYSGNFI